MSDGIVLQCARVDAWPNRSGRDPQMSSVSEGSLTAACTICRAQVWISRAARALVNADGIKPVCDSCRPARAIGVLPESGNT